MENSSQEEWRVIPPHSRRKDTLQTLEDSASASTSRTGSPVPVSIMTYRCLLQVDLLLCFSTTALSTSYSLLRFQQRRSIKVCQKLLRQLPSTPQHCLEVRMHFQVPKEMKKAQKEGRKEGRNMLLPEGRCHICHV